jgi:hypothetical protein
MDYRIGLLGSVRNLVSLLWGVMSHLLRFLWSMVLPEAVLAAKVLALSKVPSPNPVEMPFAEHDHVIQTLAAYRTDHPFREWIPPWAPAGRDGPSMPMFFALLRNASPWTLSRSRIMNRRAVSYGNA